MVALSTLRPWVTGPSAAGIPPARLGASSRCAIAQLCPCQPAVTTAAIARNEFVPDRCRRPPPRWRGGACGVLANNGKRTANCLHKPVWLRLTGAPGPHIPSPGTGAPALRRGCRGCSWPRAWTGLLADIPRPRVPHPGHLRPPGGAAGAAPGVADRASPPACQPPAAVNRTDDGRSSRTDPSGCPPPSGWPARGTAACRRRSTSPGGCRSGARLGGGRRC